MDIKVLFRKLGLNVKIDLMEDALYSQSTGKHISSAKVTSTPVQYDDNTKEESSYNTNDVVLKWTKRYAWLMNTAIIIISSALLLNRSYWCVST